MSRPKTNRDSNKGLESFLNVTEVSPEAVTISQYPNIKERAKILWRPSRTVVNGKKIDRGTKTTYQDYLDADSSVSEEITDSSDGSNWNDMASAKKRVIMGKPESHQLNSESGEEEPSRDRTLVYSPLLVTPGRTDNILDILHANHMRARGLGRIRALLDDEAGTASVPTKQGNDKPSQQKLENGHRSSMQNTEVKASAVASEEEDAAVILRKPTVKFNKPITYSNQNQLESPLKGVQHKDKEARKKLFGRPFPNSLTSSSAHTTEDYSSLTSKNRTSQMVTRFEKQLNKLSHLGFLDTPRNLRGLPSFDKSTVTPSAPTSKTIMEAGTKLHNSVNPSSMNKRMNASLPNSEHTAAVYRSASAVQNHITKDQPDVVSPVVFAGNATIDLEHAPDLASPEIRKATPQKLTTVSTVKVKDSSAANEPTILQQDVRSWVSPSKVKRTGVDEIVVSVHHSGAKDINENQLPEKQSEMRGSISNSTSESLDRFLKQLIQSGRETLMIPEPVNGTENIMDEETTAGLLFEKEMRERKSKMQPAPVQQSKGESLTDLRKTCVFRHNQLNYCTTDYVPAVEKDPIQVCNAVNSSGLMVNSWKLLTGMSKPMARLATSSALLTVLEGELELQVTQKHGKSDKTFLSEKDFASIPSETVYTVTNVGNVTSNFLVHQMFNA